MIDKSNHGKIGEALYVKMTLDEFNGASSRKISIPNQTVLTPDELNNGSYGISTGVPIYIDNDTQGNYEVVCEDGIEIHNWSD